MTTFSLANLSDHFLSFLIYKEYFLPFGYFVNPHDQQFFLWTLR